MRAGLKPSPRISITGWAEKYRMLNQEASAEPGPWRTSRTPYLREIMDCLSPHHHAEVVVFQKGGQIGATEAGNNWIGACIHWYPRPMMLVVPTLDIAKRVSKKRLSKMISGTAVLKDKVVPSRSKEAGNTLFMKEFPGGSLVLAAANSPAGLRSDPIANLFLDEVDAYPADCGGEGDPVELATKRTATFPNRKSFRVSTPTIAGLSRIEADYNETDQRRYFVPCPSCGEFQTIDWKKIKWIKKPGCWKRGNGAQPIQRPKIRKRLDSICRRSILLPVGAVGPILSGHF
jgi:phage terminase large subunit GpA-like protein